MSSLSAYEKLSSSLLLIERWLSEVFLVFGCCLAMDFSWAVGDDVFEVEVVVADFGLDA